MEVSRIDKAIQFALAVASHADEWKDHELGPIHLLKYVYLADLAYAEHHSGETYTGARWQFYKFGPWCPDVHKRIEPAVQAVRSDTRTFPWQRDGIEGEGIRYKVTDGSLYQKLEQELDSWVVYAIKKAVKEYYASTPELLHHVYETRPMLIAAPNEFLDFRPAPVDEEPPQAEETPLTTKQIKKRKQKLKEAQKRVQEKLAEKRRTEPGRSRYTPTPVYDEVYRNGVAWLDSMAGEPLPSEGELNFDDKIWKSRSRFDPDLP